MNKRKLILLFSVILVVLVIILLTPFFYWIFLWHLTDDAPSKKEIFKYVRNNEQLILQTVNEIKANYYATDLNYNILNDKMVKDITVSEDEDIYYFYCGGRGRDYYCGFYYSENDVLDNSMGLDTEPIPKGNGYIWYEKNVGNSSYSEKIVEKIYFYEDIF